MLYFLLLKLIKRKKAQFWPSVSTHFVADCRTTAVKRFEKVMEFVLISLCRRIVLLSYFNPQEANLTLCNNCDICELRPFTSIPQSVDFTVKVQGIVDSIQQVVDKPFTIKYLAQVVS